MQKCKAHPYGCNTTQEFAFKVVETKQDGSKYTESSGMTYNQAKTRIDAWLSKQFPGRKYHIAG